MMIIGEKAGGTEQNISINVALMYIIEERRGKIIENIFTNTATSPELVAK